MLHAMLLTLVLAAPDTGRTASIQPLLPQPSEALLTRWQPADPDPQQPQVVEISDGYFTRLKIHRLASFATVPLFVAQYLAGDELLKNGDDAAGWAEGSHGALAGAVAALFAVNTVTGGMNLLETRHDPEGRTWRTVHSVLMLVADAGFVATGVAANGASRETHRDIAVGSMAVALVSYAMMLPPFRRD